MPRLVDCCVAPLLLYFMRRVCAGAEKEVQLETMVSLAAANNCGRDDRTVAIGYLLLEESPLPVLLWRCMADSSEYYSVIARAISGLPSKTDEARQAIYER